LTIFDQSIEIDMKKETFQFEMDFYPSEKELDTEAHALLQQAREAASRAYAPHSHFRVGAAVELEDGTIVTGNNQENAAYPSGLCAERVALFYAHARYPHLAPVSLAITAISEETPIGEPITPCGACRQVMTEFEKAGGKDIRVILQGQEGPVMIAANTRIFLPFSFADDMLIKYAKKSKELTK
jgi:cytidine deaminase